jgi:hypothetical protein
MQKTIIKYVTGISENTATNFQKRLHKRYDGNLTYVCKNIGFDIKHGVTNDQVLEFIGKVKSDPSYANMQQNADSLKITKPREALYHCLFASIVPSILGSLN